MFNAGKTDVRVLFELGVLLDNLPTGCIDPKSELYRTLNDLTNAVYEQMPNKIVIDFTSDD